jgi:hypothetical protein
VASMVCNEDNGAGGGLHGVGGVQSVDGGLHVIDRPSRVRSGAGTDQE